MLSGARIQQRLARQALALVLAGGRGSRLQAIDRPARQAGGVFWRQVPHHRLCVVELPEFGGSPDRRPDPVQGAQPAAPSADGLVVFAPGNGRVSRPAAGAAAPRRSDVVPRDRRRGVPEFRHPARRRPEYFVVLAGDHIYKMDYSSMLADHVAQAVPTAPSPASRCRWRRPRISASWRSTNSMRIVDFQEKPRRPPAMAGKPDRALASMGIYVFTADFLYAELERDTATRPRATISART